VPSNKSDIVRRVETAAAFPPTDTVPPPLAPLAPSAAVPTGVLTTSRRTDRSRGFTLDVEGPSAEARGGGEFACVDVRGFRDAALASTEARAAAPLRLVIVAPTVDLGAFLETWAEDVEQVRRTLLISRRFDGRAFRVVATIITHGCGVETALAVESLSPPDDDGAHEIFRSGVHLKINVEAALARYREDAEADDDLFFTAIESEIESEEDTRGKRGEDGQLAAPALIDAD
jgi:hypothetical protein